MTHNHYHTLPPAQGLYDPAFEHDACGVGCIANITGAVSHDIIKRGLDMLTNLKHRGASGSDPLTGDGAGILTQIPHDFFREDCAERGATLPARGEYAVGMLFLPTDAEERLQCDRIICKHLQKEGLEIVCWRDVPINHAVLGDMARASCPVIRQVFVRCAEVGKRLDVAVYIARKMMTKEISRIGLTQSYQFYVCSFSHTTIVYKGLLMPDRMQHFYTDLADVRFMSALAVVHQRFSTNTFPTWALAHPFRMIAHNGEINTLRGNLHWIRSREMSTKQSALASPVFGNDMQKIKPIIEEGVSDSAALDNMVELLTLNGRSLPHAMMMLIPEAYEHNSSLSEHIRGFYEYHATLTEPWDGPSAVVCTDGRVLVATLDRNGLRPARYVITHDQHVILASESGALWIPDTNIKHKGRVEPGMMLLVDLDKGCVLDSTATKEAIARQQDYGAWYRQYVRTPHDIVSAHGAEQTIEQIELHQRLFGYSYEDIHTILLPMADKGEEPIGSMGNDIPPAVLSGRIQPLFEYFKQQFSQVTNPPIDPLREHIVMSIRTSIGRDGNMLGESTAHLSYTLDLRHPLLLNHEVERIRSLKTPPLTATTISTLFPVAEGEKGTQNLERAIERICRHTEDCIDAGYSIIILSDRLPESALQQRETATMLAPIPSLLITSAVHHHLIRTGRRTDAGLLIESGDVREVHHLALLLGYGASAVNPYLALATIADEYTQRGMDSDSAKEAYRKAMGKGLLKIMAKMGISTLASYRGAQIFEALGLAHHLADKYFPGTTSRLGGINLKHIAAYVFERYREAYSERTIGYHPLSISAGESGSSVPLPNKGIYQWRREGEYHAYNPASIHLLQYATKNKDYATFKKYSEAVRRHTLVTLRQLFEFRKSKHPSIPIHEVEPIETIMKRFVTGAMSFGSISKEAHEALAIAMNTIGGKSNTGEGGEDPARFRDARRSAIKQIASGRFGVTSEYVVNADELQIKVAQGAKPGEGGQLPGFKVDAEIARVRHSTPGVTLISPPPHHDIYSIEDLAQLIYDLKCANTQARISVKLVAETGVGVVSAGVAKAYADTIVIAGCDGGTGASPLSSVRHAGMPWEIGLAETQQTLVLNNLRSRVRLQVDGQIKTGYDVVIAALLGAEEYGFSTAPLVVSGCILMRKCHLNTCPVGIATQRPDLRERYTGTPEDIITFFRFIAEEVREYMALLGFRTMNEMIGHTEYLQATSTGHPTAKFVDIDALLYKPAGPSPLYCTEGQEHDMQKALDYRFMHDCMPALMHGHSVELHRQIANVHRTVGTIIGSEITARYGSAGLPPNTIRIAFRGSAGQSFGAFIPQGLTLELIGDANDYAGKSLSGGTIMIRPPKTLIAGGFRTEENVIAGNTLLYGATGGSMFVAGKVGERFAVRNSGAIAVVEGVGDHACEYMTGGMVAVLGKTGRNFGAGMSGGLAFVYAPDGSFEARCNTDMVIVRPLHSEQERLLLHSLLAQHYTATESRYAGQILTDYHQTQHGFYVVVPKELQHTIHEHQTRMQTILLPDTKHNAPSMTV